MTETAVRVRHVRVGTIVWGALVVAVAILAVLLFLLGPLGPAAVLWTIVGFGSILVLGAIAAGVVRAVQLRPAHPAATTGGSPAEISTAEIPVDAASTDRLTADSSGAPLGDD